MPAAGQKRREPLAWQSGGSSLAPRRVDLAQNYFSRISWIVSIVLL
jgi:hypothetical protein